MAFQKECEPLLSDFQAGSTEPKQDHATMRQTVTRDQVAKIKIVRYANVPFGYRTRENIRIGDSMFIPLNDALDIMPADRQEDHQAKINVFVEQESHTPICGSVARDDRAESCRARIRSTAVPANARHTCTASHVWYGYAAKRSPSNCSESATDPRTGPERSRG